MIRGMYAATSGMMTMLTRLQTISNNLANADTTGFREDTLRLTTFPQQLMSRLFDSGGTRQVGVGGGMGLVNENVVVRYDQGTLKSTDSPLDVAVQGTGFFSVQTPQGVRYTRDGSFRRDGAGQLVTSRGDLVLSPQGTPITVPAGDVNILQDGNLLVNDQPVAQIGVFDFVEPAQLKKVGNNLLEDPTGQAQATPAAGSTIHQGYLEGSNVDTARAMSNMMVAQRSYESNARMVQIQDDMLSRAVNDVGRI